MTMTTDNPDVRNGVDTAALFATIGAVKAQPEAAKFTFRATNRWVTGTHSQGTVSGFFGVGQEQMREKEFVFDGDHPTVLCGGDNGAAPVEYVLVGLAACITAGIGNIAAARKVTLHEVTSTIEGDIDLLGILGLSDEVRNGYEQITMRVSIQGDASAEVLRSIVEQSRARSAVFDIVTNGVPVDINVDVV